MVRPDSLFAQPTGRARWRVREITRAPQDSVRSADDAAHGFIRVTPPAVRGTWNSDIPFSANDGAVWAGRGLSLGFSGGVAGRVRHGSTTFDASFIPTVTYSANRPFEVFPGLDPSRSGYSSPWHAGAASADLPHRFGTGGFRFIDAGETNVRISTHGVTFGGGTRSRWWGPGIRNALVLGNNAPTIPQLFVETTRPAPTPVGSLATTLMWGGLTESRYFDSDPGNNIRPVSGLLVELRPAGAPNLTIGVARLVTRRSDDSGLRRVLDAIFSWEAPAAAGDTLDTGRPAQKTDQITSMFARWVFPEAGFEVYGEWARTELPRSLSDFAVAPHSSQGYTIGSQWAVGVPRANDRLRLHVEFTNLEQSAVEGHRPGPFYTGRATEHGFTHRGQILGATIGPGGSSQFLGTDYLAPRWSTGVFIGRTRWENDVMYRQNFPNFYKHDVTIYSGVRGDTELPGLDLSAELTVGRRMNYLFQTSFGNAGGYRSVDIQNVTLSFGVVPRVDFHLSPGRSQ